MTCFFRGWFTARISCESSDPVHCVACVLLQVLGAESA